MTLSFRSLKPFFCFTISCWMAAAGAQEISDGRSSVSFDAIRSELAGAPPGARATMSREQMARFIENLLIDIRLAEAAAAAKIAESPVVKARIERAVRDVVVKAYLEQAGAKLAEGLPDVEPMARERYEADKAKYVRPEGIRVAHVLLRVNEGDAATSDAAVRAKAEALLAELRKGADFAALAKENSQDRGSADKGGELPGWRDKGRLVAPFEKAAYALKPGEISDLVRTNFGYHIIKLLEHRPAAQLPYEEVKEQIVTRLKNELIVQRRTEWMKQFQGTTPVQIDDQVLEALRKE